MHVVEDALESQNIETHVLVQETNKPGLGQEGRAVAMGLLAQHHDARVADRLGESLEIAEVGVGGIKRAQRRRVRFQPRDAPRPLGKFGQAN